MSKSGTVDAVSGGCAVFLGNERISLRTQWSRPQETVRRISTWNGRKSCVAVSALARPPAAATSRRSPRTAKSIPAVSSRRSPRSQNTIHRDRRRRRPPELRQSRARRRYLHGLRRSRLPRRGRALRRRCRPRSREEFISVNGDGAFGINAMEIDTAVRHGAKAVGSAVPSACLA